MPPRVGRVHDAPSVFHVCQKALERTAHGVVWFLGESLYLGEIGEWLHESSMRLIAED
jgi:hypothetical protein